jgi:signal-transduction protein with cAMP-binding, CBS, and nucleotidyltransferase domain
MLTQTAVFTRLLGDHMGPPPLVVTASETCCEVVERLRSTGVSEVIVADDKDRALGIVTEQDVSRRIACSDCDDSPIESVMSTPVFSIDDEEDYLSGAYRQISMLTLRQQLEDIRAGLPPGNHAPRNALSKREKDILAVGFKAVRGFRSRLRCELTAEIF